MRAVELSDLHKSIKKNKVLKGVNLLANTSEVIGIMGTNGCGKTTLLRIICGLTSIDRGVVNVLGQNIGPTSTLPEGIGVVFDPPGLLADLTGLQNLIVIAKIRNIMKTSALRQLLVKVGLNPDDKRSVSKYSQGMRKRLGLAISMMEDPRLVLMDEPTNGLDRSGIAELRGWISELKSSGTCVVIVGHYIEEMTAVCDRIYTMDDGRLSQSSGASSRTEPASPTIR
ncbi:fluoroquinolones export ATP-binding proteinc [Peptococcaceae bacterium CEB3]|nr:fluoroquinolones export ATP-binding proteinc [Peptococcaceae bacterium CEB3]